MASKPLVSETLQSDDVIGAIEQLYAAGMTDGLPVIPATARRVEEFLDAAELEPDEVVGEVPERARIVTAEKVAINSIMAGCLPEYLPVVVAGIRAVCDDDFKFNILASTASPWPLFIVSGPVVDAIGMNYGMYLFNSGNRANTTIGRALNLTLWNCCELRPDSIQRGQMGSIIRFSSCIAENPATRWQGVNEWEGYSRQTSTITAASGFSFPIARSQASTPEAMLSPIVNRLSRGEFVRGVFVIVMPPHFEGVFVEQGWSKERIRDYLFENCKQSVKDLKEDGRWGRTSATFTGELKDNIPVLPGEDSEYIHLFRSTNPRETDVFHSSSLARRRDVIIVAAGGDVGISYALCEPYSVSTSPVTKVIKMPSGKMEES
jgi:hypothetical protein